MTVERGIPIVLNERNNLKVWCCSSGGLQLPSCIQSLNEKRSAPNRRRRNSAAAIQQCKPTFSFHSIVSIVPFIFFLDHPVLVPAACRHPSVSSPPAIIILILYATLIPCTMLYPGQNQSKDY